MPLYPYPSSGSSTPTAPYDAGDISESFIANLTNGSSQYGIITNDTEIEVPINGNEGSELTITFYAEGGTWHLYFHNGIQMSSTARALLPITLENDRSYVIKMGVAGFLWTLQEIYGPTLVD